MPRIHVWSVVLRTGMIRVPPYLLTNRNDHMIGEDFATALRALDAPYFLDGDGRSNVVGAEYLATSHDGAAVTITRLHDEITAAMRSVDGFLGTLGSRSHRTSRAGGLTGAGVTKSGSVFVVGPRSTGSSLAERLLVTGTLPSVEVQDLATRAVAVLERLCVDDGCHGLIMPESVMVGPDRAVSIRWGGLFAALRASGIDAVDVGRLLHFSSYLAPEVLRGSTENAQSDVFSLGATLYEALTGRPPFGGRTTATVMAAVLGDAGESRQPSGGERIRQAILRAIEQDPGDRWLDPQQFRVAITPARAEEAVTVVAQGRGCLSVLVFVTCALVAWGFAH